MKPMYDEKTLMSFLLDFHSNEQCEEYLLKVRWPHGLRCLHCQSTAISDRLPSKFAYQCRTCRKFLYPTAGTIFHRTRTSLLQWFIAIFLMATDKRGLSALYLSEQIEVSYPTAWAMLQRMRCAMVERDNLYKLPGKVEIDEMFIGSPTEGKKRGRGSEKTPIIVAVSFYEDDKGVERMGYAKMKAVSAVDQPTVRTFIRDSIEKGAHIRTDGLPVCSSITKDGLIHNAEVVGSKKAHLILPHVHTYISNCKAFIQGTFHGLDNIQLQHYLDEFCYRFNRRSHRKELFDRLLLACVKKSETPFAALTK